MAFTTTINSTLNTETLVNLRSKTIKFCCLISNHPSSTLHLLHMYMIMQLRSGHVTLLRTKFQPLNCPPNQTYDARRPHVGLCPIFLVVRWKCTFSCPHPFNPKFENVSLALHPRNFLHREHWHGTNYPCKKFSSMTQHLSIIHPVWTDGRMEDRQQRYHSRLQ